MKRQLLVIACVMGLAACAGPGPQPAQDTAPEPAPAQQPQPAPEPAAKRTVSDNVRALLAGAEAALAADRLTTPVHDNAFDRFQAVLLLDPDNQQAKSGLQTIFARYVSMIRGALSRGELGRASALIERAKLVDRDAQTLATLSRELDNKLEEQRQAAPADSPVPANEVALNKSELNARGEAVIAKLEALAKAVKEADESVLIVARNDEEGRWIYRQMTKAVPGYRVRGDIRLGRQPKIVILPPI